MALSIVGRRRDLARRCLGWLYLSTAGAISTLIVAGWAVMSSDQKVQRMGFYPRGSYFLTAEQYRTTVKGWGIRDDCWASGTSMQGQVQPPAAFEWTWRGESDMRPTRAIVHGLAMHN